MGLQNDPTSDQEQIKIRLTAGPSQIPEGRDWLSAKKRDTEFKKVFTRISNPKNLGEHKESRSQGLRRKTQQIAQKTVKNGAKQ